MQTTNHGAQRLADPRARPRASSFACRASSDFAPRAWLAGARRALASHWPEYLLEALGLGLFMISACAFTVLLEHPASPARQVIDDGLLRRFLIGIAMGLTAIALIYSPIGKRSGAHMNPAVTFTFWRLGKVQAWDAVFYALFQFIGRIGRRAAVGVGAGTDAGRRFRSQLRRHRAWPVWPGSGFRCRTGDLLRPDAAGAVRVEPACAQPVHGTVRRCAGRHLHHHRGAALGDEHESGPQSGLGDARADVVRPVDLFSGAPARDAAWRRRSTC